jgi:putative ubiquitin-RnfH superfamily antitoxin RatB of RatAB toxin-antitoxin module
MSDRAPRISVEVAYAEPGRQFLRRVELPGGATVADALLASGLEREFAIDASALGAGVWSRPVPRQTALRDGDRVELYRPLQVDPKESRRRRAAVAAKR